MAKWNVVRMEGRGKKQQHNTKQGQEGSGGRRVLAISRSGMFSGGEVHEGEGKRNKNDRSRNIGENSFAWCCLKVRHALIQSSHLS